MWGALDIEQTADNKCTKKEKKRKCRKSSSEEGRRKHNFLPRNHTAILENQKWLVKNKNEVVITYLLRRRTIAACKENESQIRNRRLEPRWEGCEEDGILADPRKKKKLPSTRITFVSNPVLITTGVRPEWTSSHQCTSWPFCPLDGLRFFIRRQMGFITVHSFWRMITAPFFFEFILGYFFSWTWPHT